MTGLWAAISGWMQRHAPDRDSLARNRWLRPFAHRVLRPELWRFTRRSVPRGVALGIFVGVVIPFAHSVVAAFCAFAVRANMPVAIASTWISNPFTWVLLWPLAYKIGHLLLRFDSISGFQPLSQAMASTGSDHLLTRLTGAGLATAVGLVVEALVMAIAGYAIASLVWRVRITRRRSRRRFSSDLARRVPTGVAG